MICMSPEDLVANKVKDFAEGGWAGQQDKEVEAAGARVKTRGGGREFFLS
jgi:hypothetical protein